MNSRLCKLLAIALLPGLYGCAETCQIQRAPVLELPAEVVERLEKLPPAGTNRRRLDRTLDRSSTPQPTPPTSTLPPAGPSTGS